MRKQIAIEASKIIGRNLLLLGRCISHTVEKDAKVRVKRLIFDDNLNMFFRHFADIYVHDKQRTSKVGDLLLVRKLEDRMSLDIGHEIIKVLYPLGDMTDPITGKKCVQQQYRENMKIADEMYGLAADSGTPFNYDKAPDRGWQEGRKDFSHKEAYQKWHEFEPGHELHDDPTAT